jgi:hypothetical protein
MPRIGTRSGATTRRVVAVALLGMGVGGAFSACTTVPIPPPYTDEELRAQCERRGGWWRGSLIPGYCEYQSASLSQSP